MNATTPTPTAADTGSPIVLATLCLAAFLAAVSFFATTPFFPDIASDLDTTVPLLGQAVTLSLVISAVLGLVVGPAADQYGYRRLLFGGVLAIAVYLGGVAVMPSLPVLLGLSVISAFGDALVFGLSLTLASVLFSGPARRRAISWTIASLSTGAIAGIPILTTIGDLAGWRVAAATAAGAALLIAWLVLVALPPDRHRSAARFHMRTILDAYAPLVADPPSLRLLAITTLRALWALGVITYLGAFLDEEIGLSTREIGWFYMVGGTASTIGGLLGGTRLVGSSPRLTIGAASLAGGVAIGVGLWVATLPVALVLLPLSAALGSMCNVAVASLLATESPAQPGTTMALNASLLNFGAALGAAAGGALLAIGGFGAMAVGLPLFAVAGAVLAWWPRRLAPATGDACEQALRIT